MEQSEKNTHDIKILSRAYIKIGGVDDVIGFDDTAVAVVTALGTLNIEGEDLHIIKLDVESSGCIEINGKINSVFYVDTDNTKKRKLFARRAN